MPVPGYQSFMTPVLRAIQDGRPTSLKSIREQVASDTAITDEDRLKLIKSGQPVFDNRVNWAVTYLVQAGLIERPSRGMHVITDRGLAVLAKHPDRVDNHILEQFPEFQEFKARARAGQQRPTQSSSVGASSPSTESASSQGGPRETITAAIQENNAAVASDILARVMKRDPAFLEVLVLDVLTAMGYGGATGSAERLGRSGDEGLDGVIRQDPLGLDRIYVQAKRYAADRTVGRPDIQGFVGALHGAQADRGVVITTSRFSQDAHDYAAKVSARVILIDGSTLASLLVKHNIGAQNSEAFVLKRVDEDFFEEI